MGAGPNSSSAVAADPDPATAGLPFDASEFESRLAWILGSPRTGSSWLLRLLVHPWRIGRYDLNRARAALRSRRPRGSDQGAVVPIDETFFPRHLTPFQPLTATDRQPDPEDLHFNPRNAEWINYCFSDAYEGVWRPELRRLVLVRLHAQVQEAEDRFKLNAPLVAIKEPNGSYGAQFLMSLMPRAKLIFLYRDGRDVIDSQLAVRMAPPGGRRPGMREVHTDEERLAFVRTQARLWVNNMTAVQRAYDLHDPDLRMMIRYEDLRADTFETLKPLVEWLGSDRADEQIRKAVEDNSFEKVPRIAKGKGRWRRTATPGLWRENLSAAEQRIATEIMGEKLASLGYDA